MFLDWLHESLRVCILESGFVSYGIVCKGGGGGTWEKRMFSKEILGVGWKSISECERISSCTFFSAYCMHSRIHVGIG